MEYVASYLLCVENRLEPSNDNIAMLVKAAGGSPCEADLDGFMSKIGGMSHEEIISAGSAMMTLQSASAAAAAPAANAAREAAAPAEEPSEESDALMDFF